MVNEDLIRPEDRDRPVDPAEFVILGSFSQSGIAYSPGEPVPTMTHGELERHLRSGAVRRRMADGSISDRPMNEVRGSMDILRQADHLVFRALRQKPQSSADLLIIREQARRDGRSLVIQEALQLIYELTRDREAAEAESQAAPEPVAAAAETPRPKNHRRARS